MNTFLKCINSKMNVIARRSRSQFDFPTKNEKKLVARPFAANPGRQ